MIDKVSYSVNSALVAMLGTGAGQAMDGEMHVSIGTIVAVGAVVFPLAWKLKGWMDRTEARQERIEEIIKNLACQKDTACSERKGRS